MIKNVKELKNKIKVNIHFFNWNQESKIDALKQKKIM